MINIIASIILSTFILFTIMCFVFPIIEYKTDKYDEKEKNFKNIKVKNRNEDINEKRR